MRPIRFAHLDDQPARSWPVPLAFGSVRAQMQQPLAIAVIAAGVNMLITGS